MEISFETKELRNICEQLDSPPADLECVADLLKVRLADLRALRNVSEIEPFWPNIEPDSGNYTMELGNGFTLTLAAVSSARKFAGNVGVDWSKVSRIKLIRISRSN